MIRKVYDKPRGVLPRATGLPDMELKLGKRKKKDLNEQINLVEPEIAAINDLEIK